jgi:hypothetical protein
MIPPQKLPISPERWHFLADGYLLGTLTPEHSRELESVLAKSSAARHDFRRRCNLDSTLRKESASRPIDAPAPSVPRRKAWSTPLQWAAAAAIGGIFSAPVVWALSSPKLVITAARINSLIDASFERSTGPLEKGFPRSSGVWSGDPSEIVNLGNRTIPEGRNAVRFIEAKAEKNTDGRPASSCDIFQIVDLRPLRKTPSQDGYTSIELSAQFLNGRSSGGGDIRFMCQLYLFDGDPARLQKSWPLNISEALNRSATLWTSQGGTSEWHTLSTRSFLPSQVEFAVVHLGAGVVQNSASVAVSLDEQFVDNVVLTLKTQPLLPIRHIQK